MVLHIFQSAFICVCISPHLKNWASSMGGRILRQPPRFLSAAVYTLKIPLTLSVGRTCEQDEIVTPGITIKTSILADLRERDSPAGPEEARAMLWKGPGVREALIAQSDPQWTAKQETRNLNLQLQGNNSQKPERAWKRFFPRASRWENHLADILFSALWHPEKGTLPRLLSSYNMCNKKLVVF